MKLGKRPVRRMIYLVVSIGLVLLLIGGSYFVYAAMTATDKKENDFQIGQVETKIEEVFDSSITEIPKGESIPKQVSIKNNGTIKQFVRVMVLPEVRADIVGDSSNKQILPLSIGSDLALENMNIEDWKDGGDGYYYYVKEAVEAGKSTSNLFESIKLSNSLNDQYNDAEFSLNLKVEAINCNESAYHQAWWQGNKPVDGPLKIIDDALKNNIET